jgi:membrane protein YqaA with SNARE-associated domain
LHGFISHLYSLAVGFDGVGLFCICLLDSSFLFIPLGPDLLLVTLVVQSHDMAGVYVLLAALGPVSGCALVDVLGRKGGEKGLERFLSKRLIRSLTKRVRKGAAWALSAASLMPPPFPFTAVVFCASALQYPRKKLLIVIGIARFGRFMVEGLLAIYFGGQLLSIVHFNAVMIGIVALISISFGGSVVSVYRWTKKHKGHPQAKP